MADRTKALTSLELFAGCGGTALGVSQAGFKSVAAIDWDRDACETLRMNWRKLGLSSREDVHEDSVTDFDFAPFADRVTLLAGGPPCQPFSLAGKHKGNQDSRNMFPAVFETIRAVRPKAILLENVRGLARPAFQPYFEYIRWQLERAYFAPKRGEDWREHKTRLTRERRRSSGGDDLTYDVAVHPIECANFGVPQRRSRILFVAFRSDLGVTWVPPDATHSRAALLRSRDLEGTYWTDHGIRPPRVRPPARLPDVVAGDRWRTVRDGLKGLPEPKDHREHPQLHNHVGNPGARTYPGHTGSPLDDPAKTLKAGDHGVPGGENMLRRQNGTVRYFSVREAARLQTFPDDYVFSGAWVECFRQVGNAVPVKVAHRFAEAIKGHLSS